MIETFELQLYQQKLYETFCQCVLSKANLCFLRSLSISYNQYQQKFFFVEILSPKIHHKPVKMLSRSSKTKDDEITDKHSTHRLLLLLFDMFVGTNHVLYRSVESQSKVYVATRLNHPYNWILYISVS